MVDDPVAGPVPSPSPGDATKFYELYTGLELSSEDAGTVTRRTQAHLVVIAGAADSGKTTVLASLYERFAQGPFAQFRFAGSRTLLGFEQICHWNRLASGRTKPETPRTPNTGKTSYFHLAVRSEVPGGDQCHILLSAIAGELFNLALGSTEDCERLTFLKRADTLVILIDGARLASPATRANARTEAIQLLESFLQANMLSPRCRVEFACSKLDLVESTGQHAIDFLTATETNISKRFLPRVPHLAFRRLAARPADPAHAPEQDGLEEAFASWIAPAPGEVGAIASEPPPRDARELSKYGWRQATRVTT